jgi:endonuclease/exonuclease/phosphatase (EEP) superfamily protein YafD
MDSLHKSENPILVCGDFNSTRFSRVVELMKSEYYNTFKECGWGFGFTFQGKLKLPLKIDYQFYSDGIAPLNTTIIDTMLLSDHFPLVSSYQFIGAP